MRQYVVNSVYYTFLDLIRAHRFNFAVVSFNPGTCASNFRSCTPWLTSMDSSKQYGRAYISHYNEDHERGTERIKACFVVITYFPWIAYRNFGTYSQTDPACCLSSILHSRHSSTSCLSRSIFHPSSMQNVTTHHIVDEP